MGGIGGKSRPAAMRMAVAESCPSICEDSVGRRREIGSIVPPEPHTIHRQAADLIITPSYRAPFTSHRRNLKYKMRSRILQKRAILESLGSIRAPRGALSFVKICNASRRRGDFRRIVTGVVGRAHRPRLPIDRRNVASMRIASPESLFPTRRDYGGRTGAGISPYPPS